MCGLQFVFLGNPADSGEGNFAPEQFAQFVVSLAEIGVTVNVFFDETVLPQESSVRSRRPLATCSPDVHELRLGFSNTTRNPEGILSHNNRKS
jgi:hypothetical protein